MLLSHGDVATATGKQNFLFYFILIYLSSGIQLMSIVLTLDSETDFFLSQGGKKNKHTLTLLSSNHLLKNQNGAWELAQWAEGNALHTRGLGAIPTTTEFPKHHQEHPQAQSWEQSLNTNCGPKTKQTRAGRWLKGRVWMLCMIQSLALRGPPAPPGPTLKQLRVRPKNKNKTN